MSEEELNEAAENERFSDYDEKDDGAFDSYEEASDYASAGEPDDETPASENEFSYENADASGEISDEVTEASDEPQYADEMPADDEYAGEDAAHVLNEETAFFEEVKSGKKSFEAVNKKGGSNKADKFQRTKTLAVVLGSVFLIILIFTFLPNIKKQKKENTDLSRAGKTYIPDMVVNAHPGEWNPATSDSPLYSYEEERDTRSDEEILADLQRELGGSNAQTGEGTAPVYQTQAPQRTTGGYVSSRPETNRNGLQKQVTRLQPSNYTPPPSSPSNPANPYAQFGLPSRDDYAANALRAIAGTPQGSSYLNQNNQSAKEQFALNGAGASGQFRWNSDYSLFKGTIISAVLETGINSDLPGAVIARVTKNVYSSLDGKYLLIPEGSLLYAMYNSNISYSQNRVQIAWTTLIRPDGFEIALGNMQGVDMQGFTGQGGLVDYHFFEYLKAMGIISAFSLVNGELDYELKQLNSNNAYTEALVQENRNAINQLGAKMIDRALDIQPTIKIAQGTQLNVLTNVTIELPPIEPFAVTQKYFR